MAECRKSSVSSDDGCGHAHYVITMRDGAGQVTVLRVKNRYAKDFTSASTGGYRGEDASHTHAHKHTHTHTHHARHRLGDF